MSVVRYLEKDRCLVSEGGSYPRICLGYNIFELRIMHDKEHVNPGDYLTSAIWWLALHGRW